MPKRPLSTLLGLPCLIMLLTLTACQNTDVVVENDPRWRPQHDKAIADPNLQPYLQWTDEALGDSSLLEVTVPVRLNYRERRFVQYRFTFFRLNGSPIEDAGWQHVELPPYRPVYLQGQATSRDAVDWQLEIRPAM